MSGSHDSVSQFPIYSAYESRSQFLLRTGKAKPVLLQGVFPFAGRGVQEARPINEELSYTVPEGHAAEVLYVRAGNHSDDLIYLTLMVDAKAVRYLPIGPKAHIHIPLVIVDPHPAGSVIEIGLGAPRGIAGSVVVDVGIFEIVEGL